ncbi:MAG: hypothetical protein JXA90_11565, partial [Planctomycetes bacterium]|nr:hypothetical protein [Planctomycetota bacterium]
MPREAIENRRRGGFQARGPGETGPRLSGSSEEARRGASGARRPGAAIAAAVFAVLTACSSPPLVEEPQETFFELEDAERAVARGADP